MLTTRHFIIMILCALLYVPTALAQQVQDKQHDAQTNNTISQDVVVIIQQEKVRFTAQKAVAEMRLKVFDQSSELIYDSGATLCCRRAAGGEPEPRGGNDVGPWIAGAGQDRLFTLR